MMLSKRIIACLDVRDGHVVKGINSKGCAMPAIPPSWRGATTCEGIDELVILDVTATLESAAATWRTVARSRSELFIPLTVGGGIRTRGGRGARRGCGRGQGEPQHGRPGESRRSITTLAQRYGSQAVVVAIDARRERRMAPSCTRAAARRPPRAMPSNGRARPPTAAPAKSC